MWYIKILRHCHFSQCMDTAPFKPGFNINFEHRSHQFFTSNFFKCPLQLIHHSVDCPSFLSRLHTITLARTSLSCIFSWLARCRVKTFITIKSGWSWRSLSHNNAFSTEQIMIFFLNSTTYYKNPSFIPSLHQTFCPFDFNYFQVLLQIL